MIKAFLIHKIFTMFIHEKYLPISQYISSRYDLDFHAFDPQENLVFNTFDLCQSCNDHMTQKEYKRKVCGAFNKFLDFFVQAFKIVVDSWKFSMLLLYILWNDWLIFMISTSNEQLQQ